jgi:hypothetical protein
MREKEMKNNSIAVDEENRWKIKRDFFLLFIDLHSSAKVK